jgi:rod shape determining protein RodA
MASTFSQRHAGLFTNIDWVMVLLWLMLVFVGWINIYSTGNPQEPGELFDFSQRYGKQLIWIGLAMVIALVLLVLDPRLIPPLSYLIYGVIILSLVGVLILGTEVNGSKSWFQFGGIAIQPAEFAKVATLLALARTMSRINFSFSSRSSLFTLAGIIGLPFLLIMLQPDFGSAVVLFAFILTLYRFGLWPWYLFGVMVLGGVFLLDLLFSATIVVVCIVCVAALLSLIHRRNKKMLWRIALVSLLTIGVVFTFDVLYSNGLKPHQKERIEVYTSNLQGVDKDIRNVGYNFYQSKVAIGSGGMTGKGYLEGTQTKMNFIPEQDTDFIFCTVGEEWGFLGSMAVISLYLLLMYRIIRRAEIQRSGYSKVYGYGVVSLLFFHVAINIGMTIGLAPVVGIPLPFMSYGGSSLWAFTVLLFIFIRQDMHRYEVVG